MNKLIVSIAVAVLATAALAGGAYAKPGKPGINQMPQQQSPYTPQIKLGVFKLKTGGEPVSPGDAFYPDTAAVGDPKLECLEQGGTPIRAFQDDGFVWLCRI